MKARYVASLGPRSLIEPDSRLWHGAGTERLALTGTPLALQPTAAIQVSWRGKSIGAVSRVAVSALHDGTTIAFRLEWADASESRAIDNTTSFPDAVAIAFPVRAGAPLQTMGAPDHAVNAWYWRADEEGGVRIVVAEGIGTSRTVGQVANSSRAVWKGGRWSVVITRPLAPQANEALAQLRPGSRSQYGVAVWEGSHRERAGIKAFSGDWREIQIEAEPRFGRSR